MGLIKLPKKMASFVTITAAVLKGADMLAAYAMFVMMMEYLTNVWKLNFTHAAAIINIMEGAKLVMPIGFAFLVDAFMGHYAMLLVSSIAYSIGLGFLAMSTPPVLSKSTGTCSAYQPECIGHTQKILYYTALPLIAVGISGHTVSLSLFFNKQTNGRTENDETEISPITPDSFIVKFQWTPASIFIVILVLIIGFIPLVYIKPWSIRFGIPAICTVVATLLFLSGSWSYKHEGPQGSPLTTVFRVFVASASKICHQCPQNASEIHERHNINQPVVPHSGGLRCLDKDVLPSPTLEEQKKNRWRVCSVREVEETKTGIRMVPMCTTFIIFGVVISIGRTYFIEQANHMNRRLGHWTVPLPLFLVSHQFAKLVFSYEFEKFRITKLRFRIADFFCGSGSKRYGSPTGIAIAMVLSVLCCITAAKVETQRHNVIRSHGLLDKPNGKIPMSIFWLLPQFLLLGIVDGLSEKSIAKFFIDQAPPSMSSYLKFFTLGLFGLGTMVSVLLVYIVGKVSEKGGKPNWFQGTLNRSRLDNYYWTLAVLSSVTLVLYIFLALCYPYKEPAAEDKKAPRNEGSAQPLRG